MNPQTKPKRNREEANFRFFCSIRFFIQNGGELGFKDWIFLPLGQSLGLLRMRFTGEANFFFFCLR